MTSARPYKGPLSHEEALQELALFAGRQFDPRLVEVFHQVIESHLPHVEQFSTKG
jgi:HD-GYP domain-containing protein (c-di-GMP phosphodiesterase class II)